MPSGGTLVCEAELKGHEARVWNVDWHPKLPLFVSCGEDATARIWCLSQNSGRWEQVGVIGDCHRRTVRSCSFSHDGTSIALASFDGTTSVWSCRADADEGELGMLSPRLFLLARYLDLEKTFRPLVSLGEDSLHWECISMLEGHEKEVKGVAWSSDGGLLATCGRDKTVWVWEIFEDSEFECLAILQEHTQDMKSVVWCPTSEV